MSMLQSLDEEMEAGFGFRGLDNVGGAKVGGDWKWSAGFRPSKTEGDGGGYGGGGGWWLF